MKNEDIINNIKKNTLKYKELCLNEIKNKKDDFSLVEKSLMDKFLVKLNEELEKTVKEQISYENDIKGRLGKTIDIRIDEWDEFKSYRKLIDDDAFHKTLKSYLYQSLGKYGIPKNMIFSIQITSEYRFFCSIRYNLIDYGTPIPGKENFYT